MRAKYSTAAIIILFLGLHSCTENNYPESLWAPDFEGAADPAIIAVLPDTGALGGVGIVEIIGENFSADNDLNKVHFGGSRATVLDSEPSRLTVRLPDIHGDSLTVHVAVIGAQLFDTFEPYRLIDPVINFGGFEKTDDKGAENVYGLAVDSLGNLYVSVDTKKIFRIAPDGTRSLFADIPITKFDFMRMGPGGYLYGLARRKPIYRLAPDGAVEIFARAPVRVNHLDFDSDGNIYAAGKESILLLITPEAADSVASYPLGITINVVRVFNGYVYAAGVYEGNDSTDVYTGIWRNEIEAAGQVGPTELVYDWSAFAGRYGAKINDLTFNAAGDILIASSEDVPIFILAAPYNPSSLPEQFYPGVAELEAPISHIVWGQGSYAYCTFRSSDPDARSIKRIMINGGGAPYWGRK